MRKGRNSGEKKGEGREKKGKERRKDEKGNEGLLLLKGKMGKGMSGRRIKGREGERFQSVKQLSARLPSCHCYYYYYYWQLHVVVVRNTLSRCR